jgi:hypothetical protein
MPVSSRTQAGSGTGVITSNPNSASTKRLPSEPWQGRTVQVNRLPPPAEGALGRLESDRQVPG